MEQILMLATIEDTRIHDQYQLVLLGEASRTRIEEIGKRANRQIVSMRSIDVDSLPEGHSLRGTYEHLVLETLAMSN